MSRLSLLSSFTSRGTAHALFLLLLGVDVVRTLRHAMWRDELEIYLVVVNSSSPWELLANMRYEAHPALWYFLVWCATRIAAAPVAMQLLHIVVAAGVWLLVYYRSPFRPFEKVLLLLSYFLFWEYFVISRNYALILLIGFSFIWLRQREKPNEFVLWLLLGLLANTHLFGAIWSLALAVGLIARVWRHRTASALAGAVVFLALFVFAIHTMVPPADFRLFGRAPSPPDFTLWGHGIWFSFSRFAVDVSTPLGAFIPLSLDSVRQNFAFIAHPLTATIPGFWNATPTSDFLALIPFGAVRIVALATVYAAPLAASWLVTRDPRLVLEFGLVYAGIVLFENMWNFPGGARHHGIVFVAFVAAAWSARVWRKPTLVGSVTLGLILAVNAAGGLLSLASELRPFSEGREAAAWIEENVAADAFFIGSRDAQALSVAGYLGRPFYYLGCECDFPRETVNYKPLLSDEEFGQRLTNAAGLAGARQIILVRDRPLASDVIAADAPELSATLLASFTNAMIDENFWIYRISHR